MPVITARQLAEYVPKISEKTAEALMRFTALDKVNDIYDRGGELLGPDFAQFLLNDINMDYRIGNAERLKNLPDNFITISNHPYGSLDGIILVDLFGHFRSDYKIIVNKLISLIAKLSPSFINVIPNTNSTKGVQKDSISGLYQTLSHLKDGHPLGLFPAGAVSNLNVWKHEIKDRPWQNTIIRVIQKSHCPVIPVRFFDHNSMFYYWLGFISWKIRVLRLPREFFNKRNKQERIGIGEIISVEEQSEYKNSKDLGEFLRHRLYDMEMPDNFTLRHNLFK